MSDVDVMADAKERYQAQVALVRALRLEWQQLGAPLTAEGGATGRAIVTHPLVVAIQDAEMKADRLARSLTSRVQKVGRPVGASSAPDRRAKLRAVQ